MIICVIKAPDDSILSAGFVPQAPRVGPALNHPPTTTYWKSTESRLTMTEILLYLKLCCDHRLCHLLHFRGRFSEEWGVRTGIKNSHHENAVTAKKITEIVFCKIQYFSCCVCGGRRRYKFWKLLVPLLNLIPLVKIAELVGWNLWKNHSITEMKYQHIS